MAGVARSGERSRSAMAVMDSDGLTPGLAGMAAPSVMCSVGWPHTRLYGSMTPRSGDSEIGAPPMKKVPRSAVKRGSAPGRTASNWLLINLQRHSDHHYKPDRRFPLLQTYGTDQAPQLPFGYPAMTFMAMVPPWWRRRMNPRVRAWRRQFYPEIADWGPYTRGETPMPRGAL